MAAWSLEISVHTDKRTPEGRWEPQPQTSKLWTGFSAWLRWFSQEEADPSVVKEPLAIIFYLPHPSKWVQCLLWREKSHWNQRFLGHSCVQSCPTEVTVPISLIFYSILYELEGQQGFSQSARSTGIRPGHKHLPADSPTLSVVFLLTSLAICCTLHFHCVLTITIFQGISLVFSPGCCQFLMGDFHWVPSIL